MEQETVGKYHSIDTMGLVDGPGIRTVFFMQGCPLRCAYCHNPDTISQTGGREITASEVLRIASRYRSYYRKDGGVTFSGGECLLQGAFLAEASQVLTEAGINICLDTSGFGDKRYYGKIFPHVSTILLDIKAFTDYRFKKLTTANYSVFVDFMKQLPNYGFNGRIWLRHVMVPAWTDNTDSMERLVEVAKPIWKYVDKIEILPYHTMGVEKYQRMGMKYRLEGVSPMDKDRAKELEDYARKVWKRAYEQSLV